MFYIVLFWIPLNLYMKVISSLGNYYKLFQMFLIDGKMINILQFLHLQPHSFWHRKLEKGSQSVYQLVAAHLKYRH